MQASSSKFMKLKKENLRPRLISEKTHKTPFFKNKKRKKINKTKKNLCLNSNSRSNYNNPHQTGHKPQYPLRTPENLTRTSQINK